MSLSSSVVGSAVVWVSLAAAGAATNFLVSVPGDSGPGTLRQAILDSNANPPGTNVINFHAPTFTTNTFLSVSSQLEITTPVLINTLGRVTLEKSAGTTNRLLRILGVNGTVEMSNVTFSGGSASSVGGGGLLVDGADTRVILNRCIVTNCTATSTNISGGGILVRNGATLRLQSCRLTGNASRRDGGGLAAEDDARLFLRSTVVESNRAADDGGGLSLASGTVDLLNCTVVGNRANTDTNIAAGVGGGVFFASGTTGTVGNCIFAGNVDESGSLLSPTHPDVSATVVSSGYNRVGISRGASGFTHATDVSGTVSAPLDLLLTGARPDARSSVRDGGSTNLLTAGMTEDADGQARVVWRSVDIGAIELAPDAIVLNTNWTGTGSLRSLMLALSNHNAWVAFDRDVFSVPRTIVITNISLEPKRGCWVDGASADGAITLFGPGSARLLGVHPDGTNFNYVGTNLVEFSDLTFHRGSGGAEGFSQGNAVLARYDARVLLRRCTITGGRSGSAAAVSGSAELTLENCTISGNTNLYTPSSLLFANQGGIMKLVHCTVASNYSSLYAVPNTVDATFSLFGTLVVGNIGSLSSNLPFGSRNVQPGMTGVVLVGYNSLGDPGETNTHASGFGNLFSYPNTLGPLTNNGGRTATHALLPGSSALNSGSVDPADPVPLTDQRGTARPAGTHPDIGAYEADGMNYATWREQIFPAGVATNRGPYDDPDGDQQANLVEFFTGSNPLSPSPDPLEIAVETSTNGAPEYAVYFKRAQSATVSYAGLARSTNLLVWGNVDTNLVLYTWDPGYDTIRMVIPAPTPARPRGFVRLHLQP